MNTLDESQIEALLRTAPRPAPPDGLKGMLLEQAAKFTCQPSAEHPLGPTTDAQNEAEQKSRVPTSSAPPPTRSVRPPWLRRWWPILIPAAGCVACAAVISFQQVRINHLKKEIQTLSTPLIAPKTVPPPQSPAVRDPAVQDSTAQKDEIDRLKREVGDLQNQIGQLEEVESSNKELRAKLAAAPDWFTPEETQEMDQFKEKEMSMACVNNLKQLGLSAHLWASDHGDIFPTNVLQMTNEIGSPRILVCPADTRHEPAVNWASFSSANCSYQYVGPGGTHQEAHRVLFICPIHGTVCLCDGSVQMGVLKTHPDWFVRRDGKLYFEPPKSSSN